MKLDPESLQWQFDVYRWLFQNFGGYTSFLTRDLVLPTSEFSPENHPKSIFERMKHFAWMSDWPCYLSTNDEPLPIENAKPYPDCVYRPETEEDDSEENQPTIFHYCEGLDDQPTQVIATFAHYLAYYQIHQASTSPPLGGEYLEYTTDLTAVFLGFGVFVANASFQFSQWQDHAWQGWSYRRQGYLGELDLAYGLALFCLLKDCNPKPVRRHLRPNPRSYFKTALRHLRKHHRSDLEALMNVQPLLQDEKWNE